MANLTENATFDAGVYQIETVDPVVGGPGGIANLQAQQLANRTKYLKQFADELATARAAFATLKDRLDRYDSFAPDQQTDLVAGIQEALNLAAQASRGVIDIRKRVLGQGVIYLKNKYVIQGFVLTKSNIRALHLSQTGTVGTGINKARINGLDIVVADESFHVSVPTNPTTSAVTYYAYLKKQASGAYKVEVQQTIPYDGMLLYTLTIPANDTAADLTNVTLADNRIIQANDGWSVVAPPYIYVALPDTLPGFDYGVDIEIEDATDVNAVGALTIYDKQTNGFKVKMSGSADNVRLRWTLHNTNYA